MALLNKTGITNGGTIQSEHVTRTIDALTGVSTDTIVATGSFTGSFKGPLTGTASFATSASRAVSSSFAATASYALNAAGSTGGEYMTLRVASGMITGVTSGDVVYIGTGITSSNTARVGVEIPFNSTLISASVYLNSAIRADATVNFGQISINNDVTGTPGVIGTLASLDPRNLYLDGNSAAISQDLTAGRWINLSFKSSASVTGAWVVSADILIKKN